MNNRIKIFSKKEEYSKDNRKDLIDILKPFVGKPSDFTDSERIELYGISERDLAFTDNLEDSDIAVLPLSWDYYYQRSATDDVFKFIHNAQKQDKKVISWVAGDYGVRTPSFNNLYVFRQSGYRSKLNSHHLGLPSFIRDPLKEYFDDLLIVKDKEEKPVVGFCGQAKSSKGKFVKDIFRTSFRNLQYYTRFSYYQPQDIYPSTSLRETVLNILERDSEITANFIKRKKYRAAGADKKKTTLEFYRNMKNSSYIVSVRGGGNFSVRFYEALAMGRTPLFLDTDCILPLEKIIDWNSHIIRYSKAEISDVNKILKDYHLKLTPKRFRQMQYANRKLWEDYLRLGPFWKLQLKDILNNK